MIQFYKKNGGFVDITQMGVHNKQVEIQKNEWFFGKVKNFFGFGKNQTNQTNQEEENMKFWFYEELSPMYAKYKDGKMTKADCETIKEMWIYKKDFTKQSNAHSKAPIYEDNIHLEKMQKNLSTIEWLLDSKNDRIDDVSGSFTNFLWDWWMKNETYVRKISNLLASDVLKELIDAKANGATFGALSNQELKLLQDSANLLAEAIAPDNKKINVSERELRRSLEDLKIRYKNSISKMKANWVIKRGGVNYLNTKNNLTEDEQIKEMLNL